MISCKTDCDFNDWISDNSSETEIRTLITNFFPYLSASSKQVSFFKSKNFMMSSIFNCLTFALSCAKVHQLFNH